MTTNDAGGAPLPADWEARYASTGGSYFFGTEPSALGRGLQRLAQTLHPRA